MPERKNIAARIGKYVIACPASGSSMIKPTGAGKDRSADQHLS